MISTATARYSALFALESRDLLTAAERALSSLASAAARGDDGREAIDAAFRAVHSLKGMAATLELDAVESLAHAMESVLHRARDATSTIASSVADALIDALDTLDGAVEASLEDETVDVRDAIARLGSLTADGTQRVSTTDVDRLVPHDGAPVVHVRIAATAALPAARAALVIRRLSALGAVDESLSSGGALAVRLRTGAADHEIAAVVRRAGEVADVRVERRLDARSPAPGSQPVRRAEQVRVARDRLDALLDVSAQLTVARARLAAAVGGSSDPRVATVVAEVVRLIGHLHEEVRATRTAPASEVFERLPRVARDIARSAGKRAELVIEGGDVALDRAVLEELSEPLIHLLRNAIDHGIEAPADRVAAGKDEVGRVVVRSVRERDVVTITVSDDGRGIERARVAARAGRTDAPTDDAELLALIARPGFTTAASVGRLSGRGVGIDAVRDRVRRVGGSLSLATEAGRGTSFTLRLPLTVAVGRALVVRVGGVRYALPIAHVRETVALRDVGANGCETVTVRDETLPALRLDAAFDVAPDDRAASIEDAVIVEEQGRRVALLVDAVDGQDEVLVKPLPPVRGALACFGGATLLADGTPALVLDVPALLSHRFV